MEDDKEDVGVEVDVLLAASGRDPRFSAGTLQRGIPIPRCCHWLHAPGRRGGLEDQDGMEGQRVCLSAVTRLLLSTSGVLPSVAIVLGGPWRPPGPKNTNCRQQLYSSPAIFLHAQTHQLSPHSSNLTKNSRITQLLPPPAAAVASPSSSWLRGVVPCACVPPSTLSRSHSQLAGRFFTRFGEAGWVRGSGWDGGTTRVPLSCHQATFKHQRPFTFSCHRPRRSLEAPGRKNTH